MFVFGEKKKEKAGTCRRAGLAKGVAPEADCALRYMDVTSLRSWAHAGKATDYSNEAAGGRRRKEPIPPRGTGGTK